MIGYHIFQEGGHYVVYINDAFYCSADTWEEAFHEVENYIYLEEEIG